MTIRNPLNYDKDQASLETGLACEPPSMTQQQFKDESDINTIVKRFGITGQLPAPVRMPSYEDFSSVGDYQSALNAVRASGEAFMTLPAAVRARFGHEPGALLDFLENPANRDEAVKLGLVVPPAPPAEPKASA